MTTTVPDLWPTELLVTDQPAPAAILRQQGYLLGQKTQNFVVGEVESSSKKPGEFLHQFWISAPLLGYRQPVLHVMHGVTFYPAQLIFYGDNLSHRQTLDVVDATDFMNRLRKELATPALATLIGSLAAQCQDPDLPG